MLFEAILNTPVAVLLVAILAIVGVACVIFAVIGKTPRLRLKGKEEKTVSSLTVKGGRIYVLGAFGMALLVLAVYLVFSSPAQQARAREDLRPTVSVLETRAAEPITVSMREEVVVTQMVLITPTAFATPTPDPFTLDAMDEVSNWIPSFCNEQCGGANGASALLLSPVSGVTDQAVELVYDLKDSGWVLITKNIDPNSDLRVLSRADGISFLYKSTGAPNTIELKLLLRYPGETEDTAFGASWKTKTSDTWTRIEARFDKDITCWWPAALCKQHGDVLELTALRRIDLAISNKPGDIAGLGRIAFDDLVGIAP